MAAHSLDRPIVVSDRTSMKLPVLVVIGATISLLGAGWAGHVWMDRQFSEQTAQHVRALSVLQNQLVDLKTQVDQLDRRIERIEAKMSNRWTSQDMQIWEHQMKADNPTIKVPSVKAILDSRTIGSSTER